jgi:hypothetical protein
MLTTPIGGPANMFIWILCILIGFTAALIVIDNLPKRKKEKSDRS